MSVPSFRLLDVPCQSGVRVRKRLYSQHVTSCNGGKSEAYSRYMSGGRTDASDGRVFPYVFNPPINPWSRITAVMRFIGQRVGGMDQLKGRKIAHVYFDNEGGREILPILDAQATHYGFTEQRLAVTPPG